MKEVLTSLLEMNLYAVIIWAGIMVVRKLAGNRMSPKLSLAIWVLFIARLLCPVTFDVGVHLLPTPPAGVQSGAPAHEVIAPQNVEVAGAPALADRHTISPDMGVASARGQQHKEDTAKSVPAMTEEQMCGVLVTIWIAGIAIIAAYTIGSYARVRSRVRQSSCSPSDELEYVFLACCKRLGIQKRLHLVVSNAVRGPALLVPDTVLYPPSSDSMSEDEMEMSMVHELTHYVRRDWVLLVLFLLLRTVHWFNPVVWIATREMREDMEGACDNTVVTGWSQAKRADYARTILSLYGKCALKELVSFADSRSEKQAEKRIRRIFMKTKSSRKGRLIALLAAGILMLTCFTTACQQAPMQVGMNENLARPIQTQDQAHEQVSISEPSLESETEQLSGVVPALASTGTWEAQLVLPDGTLEINASTYLPNANTLPVYKIEDTQISPEMAETVARVLWGENMPEFKVAPGITKERRDSIVAQYRDLIRRYEEEGPDPDETMSGEERIAQWQAAIEKVERQYQESLKADTQQAADFSEFYDDPATEEYGLKYDALFADGSTGQLEARPAEERPAGFGGSICYRSQAWENQPFAGFTGNLDDVVQEATRIAGGLGLGTWTLDGAENDEELQCAYVRFRHAVGFVPMIDDRLSSATYPSMMTSEQSAAYERGEFELPVRLASETLKMFYDDNGLVAFFLESPRTITGTVEEAPTLLSLEDAQEIFLSGFADNNADNIPASDIDMDRVELAYAYAYDQDTGEMRLIPVYDFAGALARDNWDAYPMSFMTVNALDGSIYQRERSM